MNSKYCLMLLLVNWLFFSCGIADKSKKEIEQNLPFQSVGDSVVLISPGNLSSANPEFATSWSEEINQLVFNRTSPDRSIIQIFTTTFADNSWAPVKVFPYSDSSFRDIDPFIYGNRMYFSSNRPETGSTVGQDYDIYFSEWINQKWNAPIKAGGGINTGHDEIYVTISKNGTFYFTVFETGTRNAAIYKKIPQAGPSPEKIIFENDTARITNPAIAPDESFMIAASGNLPGYGSADLYISYPSVDDKWTDPQNLGPKVNTEYTEFAPGISSDGKYLFFTSERPGIVSKDSASGRPPGDLYIIQLANLLKR